MIVLLLTIFILFLSIFIFFSRFCFPMSGRLEIVAYSSEQLLWACAFWYRTHFIC